jgi:hypothetical protein
MKEKERELVSKEDFGTGISIQIFKAGYGYDVSIAGEYTFDTKEEAERCLMLIQEAEKAMEEGEGDKWRPGVCLATAT